MFHLRRRAAHLAGAAALSAATFTFSTAAEARSFRVDQIPNGRTRSCQTCHETGGGIVFNNFGSDVRSHLVGEGPPQDKSVDWAGLFALDSDGDGVTNGAELGDPEGTWRIGDPDPPGFASAPGDPNNAAASGGCGDGILGAAETCDSDQLRGATCDNQNLGQGEMLCGLDCRLDTTNCDKSVQEEEEPAAPADDGCAVRSTRDGDGALAAASALALLLASGVRRRTRARR